MINRELINPQSIVVVGGSNNVHKPGGRIVRNLLDGKYKGELCVVNAKETDVQGVKSYTSVHDNQLMRYKQIFEETYSNTPFQSHLNFVLVTCFDNPPECLIQACKESDFRCLPLLDLFSNEQKEDSETDLFNEFWLRQW